MQINSVREISAEPGQTASAAETQHASVKRRDFSADALVVTFGSLAAAVFGAALVFVIPRLLSVEEFGYWRLFLLYAGYTGLLHLGCADGALLAWAGRDLQDFGHEIRPAARFILVQHLVFVLPVAVAAALLLPAQVRFIAAGVFVFALIQNVSVLLQSSLQAARDFVPVTVATTAPSVLFLLLSFAGSRLVVLHHRTLIVFYLLSTLAMLGLMWKHARAFWHLSSVSAWDTGTKFIGVGWAVMLTNFSFGMTQTADRLIISSVFPIYQFAQYSLAASVIMVPGMVINGLSRVYFPHLAAREAEKHPGTYRQAARLIAVAWSILLPYYILVEIVVRHYLGKYTPSLPIVRVLLLEVVFFGFIQILQASMFNLYRRQREFFLYAVIALVGTCVLIGITAFVTRSLVLIAWVQVSAMAAWALFNAYRLRTASGETFSHWARILALLACSAAALLLVPLLTQVSVLQILLYYAMTALPLVALFRGELLMLARGTRSLVCSAVQM